MKSAHSVLVFLALYGCTTAVDQTEPHGEPSVLHVAPSDGGEWDDPEAAKHYRAFTTIQDAIDNAVAGDTVLIPTGTYLEDVYMVEGVHVEGAGAGETIIAGYVDFENLGTNTNLSRVSVLNPGTLFTDTGILIQDSTATISELEIAYWEIGLDIFDSLDVRVSNSEFALNTYGLWSDDSYNSQISNNLFRGNSVAGITNYTSTGDIVHNTLVGNAYGARASSTLVVHFNSVTAMSSSRTTY